MDWNYVAGFLDADGSVQAKYNTKVKARAVHVMLCYTSKRDTWLILKKCLPCLLNNFKKACAALELIRQNPLLEGCWRTKIPITEAELRKYMRVGMTTRAMAKKFGVSTFTIVRRKREFGLPVTRGKIDRTVL